MSGLVRLGEGSRGVGFKTSNLYVSCPGSAARESSSLKGFAQQFPGSHITLFQLSELTFTSRLVITRESHERNNSCQVQENCPCKPPTSTTYVKGKIECNPGLRGVVRLRDLGEEMALGHLLTLSIRTCANKFTRNVVMLTYPYPSYVMNAMAALKDEELLMDGEPTSYVCRKVNETGLFSEGGIYSSR